MKRRLLLLRSDDDKCVELRRLLGAHGFEVVSSDSLQTAARIAAEWAPSVVLCEESLEPGCGSQLFAAVTARRPDFAGFVLVGDALSRRAVLELMERGLFRLLPRDCDSVELLNTVERAALPAAERWSRYPCLNWADRCAGPVSGRASIGLEGFFFPKVGREERPVGALVPYDIDAPSLDRNIQGLGRVLWERPLADDEGPAGFGIGFEVVLPESTASLFGYLGRRRPGVGIPRR